MVVSTAAFHARVRGSFPGLGALKETNMFLPHPLVKLSIVGGLHDREVACSASDRQASNFESRFWRAVSSHSSHHLQEVLLAQISLYVHKSGLKPDLFHFIQRVTRRQCLQIHHAVMGYTPAVDNVVYVSTSSSIDNYKEPIQRNTLCTEASLCSQPAQYVSSMLV